MAGMTRLLLLLLAGVTVSTAKDLYKRIAIEECNYNQRHHHVKLQLPKGEKDICGGTLISNRWILTAAHCNDNVIKAYLGLHPQTDKKIPPVKVTPVPFPDGDDIMLLKLHDATSIQPAALPTADDCKKYPKEGDKVQIAGYGPADFGGPLSDTLRCANAEVEDCDPPGADIGRNGHYFCADTQTLAAMKGDSGGGVMLNNKLYGVISEGGGHPIPMYYMDVCEYLKWITDTMKT